jgi:hypothetical protein
MDLAPRSVTSAAASLRCRSVVAVDFDSLFHRRRSRCSKPGPFFLFVVDCQVVHAFTNKAPRLSSAGMTHKRRDGLWLNVRLSRQES